MERTRFILVNISPSKNLIARPPSKAVPFFFFFFNVCRLCSGYPAAVLSVSQRAQLINRPCRAAPVGEGWGCAGMLGPGFLCKAQTGFASAMPESVGFF